MISYLEWEGNNAVDGFLPGLLEGFVAYTPLQKLRMLVPTDGMQPWSSQEAYDGCWGTSGGGVDVGNLWKPSRPFPERSFSWPDAYIPRVA